MSCQEFELDLADGVSATPFVEHKLVPSGDFERNGDLSQGKNPTIPSDSRLSPCRRQRDAPPTGRVFLHYLPCLTVVTTAEYPCRVSGMKRQKSGAE